MIFPSLNWEALRRRAETGKWVLPVRTFRFGNANPLKMPGAPFLRVPHVSLLRHGRAQAWMILIASIAFLSPISSRAQQHFDGD
jgi:hypothetical protein